jgi:hypothetical protein
MNKQLEDKAPFFSFMYPEHVEELFRPIFETLPEVEYTKVVTAFNNVWPGWVEFLQELERQTKEARPVEGSTS